jgi:hypothetical protein
MSPNGAGQPAGASQLERLRSRLELLLARLELPRLAGRPAGAASLPGGGGGAPHHPQCRAKEPRRERRGMGDRRIKSVCAALFFNDLRWLREWKVYGWTLVDLLVLDGPWPLILYG